MVSAAALVLGSGSDLDIGSAMCWVGGGFRVGFGD